MTRYINPMSIGLLATCVVIVSIVAWLTPWVWVDPFPKPLGDRLEYIGKKDYGCWLGYCDSKVGTTYYYATDMSIEEVEGYFRGARLENTLFTTGNLYDSNSLEFRTSNKNGFDVSIYKDKAAEAKYLGIPVPSKRYILSIPYFSYPVARDALL